MKKISLYVGIIFLIYGMGTAQEFAKVGTAGAQFLKIGVGARGTAMGEAYDAICNDATSIFWNPAGLAFVKKQSATFSHANWLADIKYDAGAYAYSLGPAGVVGVSFAYLNSGDIEETTVEMQEGTGNYFTAGNLMFGASYARMLTDRFSIGGNVKYVEEKLADEKASAWGIDVGILYFTGFKSLRLGMSIRNFGPELQFSGKYRDYDNGNWVIDPATKNPQEKSYLPYHLPMTFKISVAYDLVEQENTFLTVGADLAHPNDNVEKLNLGAELTLMKILALRLGYTGLVGIMKREDTEIENVGTADEISYNIHNYTQNLGAGMGLLLNLKGFGEFNFDYAYTDFGVLDWVHRMSVTFNF
ncbi:PorV/PorQ family protein [candidate division KSB1 bacterium]|nr:PorV/PorQ family protein [candidate division KSB1 bacterium]